jgi:peptidase A4-like protein
VPRRIAAIAVFALTAWLPSAALAAAPVYHGHILRLAANQSSNWSGYNQGSIEQGGKMFNAVAGGWIVPRATPHKPGEAEFSSTWIGIGGGCVDAGCPMTDATLIQTGTEQDVSASGTASYSAWYELIPAPGITISSLAVHPGDRMKALIAEMVPGSNLWTISIKNITTGKWFTTTVPYASTHATAEWITETPVVIGGGGGVTIGPMPDLTRVRFGFARTNSTNAGLTPSEAIQLVDPNTGVVVSTPSNPNSRGTAFNTCTYARSCPAP